MVNLTQIFILQVITILRQTLSSSAVHLDIKNIFTYLLFHLPSPTYCFHPFLTDINHLIPTHINFCIKLRVNHLALTTSVPEHLFPTFLLYLQLLESLSDFHAPFLRPASSAAHATLVRRVSRFFNPTWLSSKLCFRPNCVTSHIICCLANAETLESATGLR